MPEPIVQPVTLFYAYSHRDAELRGKLDTHLALLKSETTGARP